MIKKNKFFLCRTKTDIECRACPSRVISRAFIFHGIATVIKYAVGVLAGSQVLIAEAVHSFTDTTSYAINYLGARSDKISHVFQSAIIGSIMMVTGIWICVDNLAILILGRAAHPGLIAPIIAGLAILSNLYLNNLSKCAAELNPDDENIKLCSIQNKVNLWAALSGFTGIMLAEMGLVFCDPLFAMGIGFLQVSGAVEIFRDSLSTNDQYIRKAKTIVTGTVCVASICIIGFFTFTVKDDIVRSAVILIPSEGEVASISQMDSFLGRAHYFSIIDLNNHTTTVIRNSNWNINGDVSDNLVHIVKKYNIGTVIAYKIGDEMFADLKRERVRMYYTAMHTGTVGQVFSDYQHHKLLEARASNVDKGFGRNRISWISPW
jgi:predicted Fe-Mo cluster-binding NifX family protein